MKIVDIQHNAGKFFLDGTHHDYDKYQVEARTPMASHDLTIYVDHEKKEVYGESVRYGCWEDMEKDEVIKVLKLIDEAGELEKPYKNYI